MGVLTLNLVEVDDTEHVICSSNRRRKDGGSASIQMEASVWQHLPENLVETVLLFLPPSSQAHFCRVCKRWRKLIKSAAFQDEAADMRNHCLLCFVQLPGCKSPLRLPGELSMKSLKVHKLHVDMPGWTIPSHLTNAVFSHGCLVAVASWNWEGPKKVIWCWLLNIAKQSWRQLPSLVPRGLMKSFNVWVTGSDISNFQVSLIMSTDYSKSDALYTFSGNSTTWRIVDIPQVAVPAGVVIYTEPGRIALCKLGYILVGSVFVVDSWDHEERVWLWEGTSSASPPTPLPIEPMSNIRAVSHPDTDAVFGVPSYGDLDCFKVFRLDGSSGEWKWKCVVPGLPQGCVLDDCNGFRINRAKIVGNKVLIEVWLETEALYSVRGCLFLTYHILSGCYEWLSAFSNQEFKRDFDSNSWTEGLMDPTAFIKLQS